MKIPQFRGLRARQVQLTGIAAICLAGGIAALPAAADNDDDQSIIDIIIDWIEDLLEPEPSDQEMPSDGDDW